MTMHLYGRTDNLVTYCIGMMFDEPHVGPSYANIGGADSTITPSIFSRTKCFLPCHLRAFRASVVPLSIALGCPEYLQNHRLHESKSHK